MNKTRKTSNAVRILHHRYVGEDVQRKASLEQERVNAGVARTIYELRGQAGLSQKELAERVDTTQSVISRLEDADYEGHSLSMLNRIAKALNQQVQVVMRPQKASGEGRHGLVGTLAPKAAAGRTACAAVKPGDIETARKRIGLSREAFARTFGLSPAALRQWENGQREPTGAARILLTIISREPEAALRAVR